MYCFNNYLLYVSLKIVIIVKTYFVAFVSVVHNVTLLKKGRFCYGVLFKCWK